jgi:hypothetical protein
MENMGRQKLADKTIMPLEAGPMPQQLSGLTVAQALQSRYGVYLLGGYKGATTFVDFDKLVNEPLALVEGIYALDRLDARDIITATFPINSPIGTVVTGQLVVPAGELWLLNRINLLRGLMGAGEIAQINFRISAWQFPDARGGATVNSNGRAYLAATLNATDAVAIDADIDLPAQGEIGAELRLKAGDIITLEVTLAGAIAAAARDVTLTPFGRKIRRLVA